MMLIGRFLFIDKSATLVPLIWLLLLEDFDHCRWLSWESALLPYTYHSLCTAFRRDVTGIAGCISLVLSWIYQIFQSFCLVGYNILKFPLAVR
ncbi:hypothetical protein AHAS_Ahas12G0052900 [Arachis hypogaea]